MSRILTRAFACAVLVSVAAGGGVLHADVQEKLDDIRAKLPEIKVKETVISVTPQSRIYIPNGALDLSLKQEFEKTSVEFSSRYDFVDNFMGFDLDFQYALALPTALGLDLSDRVDFKETLSNNQYSQRTQALTPYLQYRLTPFSRVRTALRFENTSTENVDTLVRVDHGRNIVGEIGYWHDTITTSTGTPHGGAQSVSLQRSFGNLGSDYDYAQVETSFRQFLYPFRSHVIESEARFGYPLTVTNRPLTSFYDIGGYRILKGYGFKEFRGDALMYGRCAYTIPLSTVERGTLFRIRYSLITWNVFAEIARIGSRDIYAASTDLRASAGTGIGYKVVILKYFPVQLDLSGAKAFDDRAPAWYFTISTIYYTWGNS